MLKIFYSNRIECLYQEFKRYLFEDSSPFSRRIIIVPTPAIKSWLLIQLAKDPEFGIAAGVEFLYLDDSLQKIEGLLSKKKSSSYVPNLLELTLAIENYIRCLFSSLDTLSEIQRKNWQPIIDYCFSSDHLKRDSLSQRNEKRLVTLSQTLAKLFIEYGKYGKAMVDQWTHPDQGWQQDLWMHIFSTWNLNGSYDSDWTGESLSHVQIHLFSISFLPKSAYTLFEKASSFLPMHYYSLSPCQVFWTDSLTDKESQRLQKYWKKSNVSMEEQRLLTHYLKNNPLLANWGKLGRKMAEVLEKADHEIEEHYSLPSSIKKDHAYRELLDETIYWEDNKTSSLLDLLHADILLMRTPAIKMAIAEDDQSVQFHSAPNLFREVQILYNNLLSLIEKEKDLEPADILVMAPDINTYAPYIKQVFGAKESLLDFQLMDMPSSAKDSLVQQFWHLIQLSFGHWNAADLLYLFTFPSFQKKQGFSNEDLTQIQTWIEESNIRWGENSFHRNQIMERRYGQKMAEDTNIGTWEGGFSRLLESLVQETPEIHMEFSLGILLGKWIALLQALRKDLKPFSDGNKKTYREWIQDLRNVIYTYLVNQKKEEEEQEELLDRLDEFEVASRCIPEQKVSFVALKKHLTTFLKQHTVIFRENQLQTVRFCSLLPMRAIPAKIIAIMGLQENAFPRRDYPLSYNLMQQEPSCDYCPSRTDYDRYLFLEALLSCRKYFILSYQKYDKEAKEQVPSPLVLELLNYIDQGFEYEKNKNQKISNRISYFHPYYSFDARYFSHPPELKNYSYFDYRAALSYYNPKKNAKHCFIVHFNQPTQVCLSEKEIILNIKDLKTAIHNPFKHFFNKTLGIYIKEEEDLPSEEPFVVEHLLLYDLKKMSLKQNLKVCLENAEKEGKLPLGLFKKTAVHKIGDVIGDLHNSLEQMNIEPAKLFEITLHDQYEKPFQDPTGWKLPPLTIKYKDHCQVKIIGSFPEVSEKGLIAHIYFNKNDMTKAWADFVIFNYLIDQYRLPIQKKLLCTKSGKIKEIPIENAEEELKKLLDYYFQSLEQLSPLASEWLHDVMHVQPEDLQKSIDKKLNDPFNPIYNEYIKWICKSNGLKMGDINDWRNKAHELYSSSLF